MGLSQVFFLIHYTISVTSTAEDHLFYSILQITFEKVKAVIYSRDLTEQFPYFSI